MSKPILAKAVVVSTIYGTQGTFNKGDLVDVRFAFKESGNFLIGIGNKAVYATHEELELV